MSVRLKLHLRASVAALALFLGATAAAQAAPIDFDLPAQPLATSLREVAHASGLTVAVETALVADKAAPALKGKYEPDEALRRLLAGSGLTITFHGNEAVVTRQTGDVQLAPVKVSDSKEPVPGSAAAGYLVQESTTAGPVWGDMKLQDAPYSMGVVSSELIDNTQAYKVEDVYKYIPQITNYSSSQNNSGYVSYSIRGFSQASSAIGATTVDGLLGNFNEDIAIEDKERVEVLSGVDGFLYGMGGVGGNVNFVLKRPTAETYNSITVGDNAGANGYVHGDFGGPIGDKFGYRINVVKQDGDTSIKDQSINRHLVSGAFDIRPTDDLLIQLNASDADYRLYGLTPSYSTSLNPYPKPADPSEIFSPAWTSWSTHTDVGGEKVTWTPNDIFTVREQYNYTYSNIVGASGTSNVIQNYNGTMSESLWDIAGNVYGTHSGYTFLDSSFSIFGIKNKLTTGFTGMFTIQSDGKKLSPSFSYRTATNNFYDQIDVAEPGITYSPTARYLGHQYLRNYLMGDEIKINDQFTIMAGGNLASYASNAYGATGLSGPGYNASALTPSVSGIYKPLPWLSTYVTYQQSLQNGMTVQNSGSIIYTNNGQILPPYMGDQYEVGVKATVANDLLLTAALFDIDKANQYQQANSDGSYTYVQSGREEHKGLELTATGKARTDLTIIGGLTLLDPRITSNDASPWQNGQLAQGVSQISGKLYAEYDLPPVPGMPFLQGLTLIGGFQAVGPYVAKLRTSYTTPNVWLPGYVVGDLGLRYAADLYGTPTIFRFNVDNITNEAYWQSSSYEGSPRTFLGTVTVKF